MYDIIIIGAGAAGMNAALYASRNGKKVLIIESGAIGGQISNSPKVENFPTYSEISGSDFADKFFEQISAHGVEIEFDKVIKTEKKDDIFFVTCEYGEFQAKSLIAAVGVTHKKLNVPGEENYLGKGVYYCAVCDGPFYKDKEVALIGDGNTAMQYALLLANICKKVYLLTWMDKFFGDKALENRIRSRENIVHMPNTSVTSFTGNDKLTGVEYEDRTTKDKHILSVPAVFVAIGQIPDNEVFSSLAQLDKQGYFITDDEMKTQTDGFFVAGDCRAKKTRQLATAISDGAIAALSACAFTEK